MPELPEVETIRRTLQTLKGLKVTDIVTYDPKCIVGMAPTEFRRRLLDREVVQLTRRGKYVVLVFDDDAHVVVDLRMTGRLILRSEGDDDGKSTRYTRLFFLFYGGIQLRFDDQRKFGRVMWFPDEHTMEARLRLGPEPIDPRFGPKQFGTIVKGRRRSIKSLLLDQRLVSGLGNIYADEALFRARIIPTRPAGRLDEGEITVLWRACRDVLLEAIAHRGTTLRDYVDGDGRTGDFGGRLQVYGREGDPCFQCDHPIKRMKIAGRSSSYCPICQR